MCKALHTCCEYNHASIIYTILLTYKSVQHKDVLGNMFIDKVQVFKAATGPRNPCIVMHLSKPQVSDEKKQRRKAKEMQVQVVKMIETQPLRAKL